ncbi:MAG TPA: UDP-N-acetylmuramate--alanine ligase [Burkholderiales bacterium]|nr:UDP-N-acetylmuramate--alanine ligase [Burkholderiales bacterium]
MAKERSKKYEQMRERIAYLAARLIAEDGIDDFSQAKRKAAQQIGAPDTHCLPNNGEIEKALRTFRSLYQQDEHPEQLSHLRLAALDLMRLLNRFNPYLSGPVLTGTAGKYSEIDLQLYTDSVKDVEFFLINNRIPYRSGEIRTGWGSVPVFKLEQDGIKANVAVYSENDLHAVWNPRISRAKLSQVEELLSED